MRQRITQARENFSGFMRNVSFTLKSSWRVAPGLMIIKLLLYLAQGLLPILLAFLTGRLIDTIVDALAHGAGLRSSLMLVLALAGASFVYGQSQRIDRYVDTKFGIAYEMHLNQLMQLKFVELDHSYYEDAEFNKLVNKIEQNFGRLFRYTNELFYLFASIVEMVGSGIALIFLNPLITVILILGITPQLRVQLRSAKERWRFWEAADHEWRLRWSIRHSLMDTLSIGEHKIFQLPTYLSGLWKKYFTRTQSKQLEIERSIRNRQFLAGLSETGVQIGVDIWLLVRVFQGIGFTIGNFEFYRRVIGGFSNAMSRLLIGLQTVNEVGLYMSDFLKMQELQPRVTQPRRARRLAKNKIPRIEFKDVSFKYPKSKRYVLKDISFVIEPGEDIAMVGENGAGKTTIIKLLMRFYDVTSGEILINGINIKDLNFDSWYRHVGALFQQFNLYNFFKARRSIGVGNVAKVDDLPGIKKAAAKAGIDTFISKLGKGYETVLSKVYEEGTDLSGGEWQRIALARTFFRNANVLILDEPTASIDAKGEYEIFQKIAKTQKSKTTIIISHRFSTVRNAKKILVIEHGKITEQGSHQQLMKLEDGRYKEMFELQAAGYR